MYVAKGIEEDRLTATLSQQIQGRNPRQFFQDQGHAEEEGRGLPTTCVVGAKTKKTAEYLRKHL